MGRKKRHSREEIAAKLTQAAQLAAQGRLQSDIARALGVSLMTLHRWRDLPVTPHSAATVMNGLSETDQGRDTDERVGELQIENLRLRRLVTDLLLETMKLEEATQDPKSPTRRAPR